MGILLCEHNFRDVWIRHKSVRAEIGQILRTHTHTHAAKLVVEMGICQKKCNFGFSKSSKFNRVVLLVLTRRVPV